MEDFVGFLLFRAVPAIVIVWIMWVTKTLMSIEDSLERIEDRLKRMG